MQTFSVVAVVSISMPLIIPLVEMVAALAAEAHCCRVSDVLNTHSLCSHGGALCQIPEVIRKCVPGCQTSNREGPTTKCAKTVQI